METWWKKTRKSRDVVDHKRDLVAWACQAHSTVTSALTNARSRDLGPPDGAKTITLLTKMPCTTFNAGSTRPKLCIDSLQKTNMGQIHDSICDGGHGNWTRELCWSVHFVWYCNSYHFGSSKESVIHSDFPINMKAQGLTAVTSKIRYDTQIVSFRGSSERQTNSITSCIWYRNQSSGVVQSCTVTCFWVQWLDTNNANAQRTSCWADRTWWLLQNLAMFTQVTMGLWTDCSDRKSLDPTPESLFRTTTHQVPLDATSMHDLASLFDVAY